MEAREKGEINLMLSDLDMVCSFHNVPPFIKFQIRTSFAHGNISFKQKIPSSNRDEETLRGTTLVASTK